MVKHCFRLAGIVLALSAILIAWGCTVLPQKQLRTYPAVNHLSESSVLTLADEAFRQMGYSTRYDHGGIIGKKELDYWRIAIFVVVGSDAKGNTFLKALSGVDAKGLAAGGELRHSYVTGGVRKTVVNELEKFHQVFGALAVQSGLPKEKIQETEPLSTSHPEQEPKGFE
jgi:hypothetical protein